MHTCKSTANHDVLIPLQHYSICIARGPVTPTDCAPLPPPLPQSASWSWWTRGTPCAARHGTGTPTALRPSLVKGPRGRFVGTECNQTASRGGRRLATRTHTARSCQHPRVHLEAQSTRSPKGGGGFEFEKHLPNG